MARRANWSSRRPRRRCSATRRRVRARDQYARSPRQAPARRWRATSLIRTQADKGRSLRSRRSTNEATAIRGRGDIEEAGARGDRHPVRAGHRRRRRWPARIREHARGGRCATRPEHRRGRAAGGIVCYRVVGRGVQRKCRRPAEAKARSDELKKWYERTPRHRLEILLQRNFGVCLLTTFSGKAAPDGSRGPTPGAPMPACCRVLRPTCAPCSGARC